MQEHRVQGLGCRGLGPNAQTPRLYSRKVLTLRPHELQAVSEIDLANTNSKVTRILCDGLPYLAPSKALVHCPFSHAKESPIRKYNLQA